MKRHRLSVTEALTDMSSRITQCLRSDRDGSDELGACLEDNLSLLLEFLQSGESDGALTICKFTRGLILKCPPTTRWGGIATHMAALLLLCGKDILDDSRVLDTVAECHLKRVSPTQTPLSCLLYFAMCATSPSQSQPPLCIADMSFVVEGHIARCYEGGIVTGSFPLPLLRESGAVVSTCRTYLQRLKRVNSLRLQLSDWVPFCQLADLGCEFGTSPAWASLAAEAIIIEPPGSDGIAHLARVGVAQSSCGEWRHVLARLSVLAGGEEAIADAVSVASATSVRALLRTSTQLISKWVDSYPQVRCRLQQYIASQGGVSFLSALPPGYSSLLRRLFPDQDSLLPVWEVIQQVPDGWRCVAACSKLWSSVPVAVAQLPCAEFIRCPSMDAALGVRAALRISPDGVRDLFARCLLTISPYHIGFIHDAIPLMAPAATGSVLKLASPDYASAVFEFITAVSPKRLVGWCEPSVIFDILHALDGAGLYSSSAELGLCEVLSSPSLPGGYWGGTVRLDTSLSHWGLVGSLLQCLSKSKVFTRVSQITSSVSDPIHALVVACVVAFSIFELGEPFHIDVLLPSSAISHLSTELKRRYSQDRARVASSSLGPTIAQQAKCGGLADSVLLSKSIGWGVQDYLLHTGLAATPEAVVTLGEVWGMTSMAIQQAFCHANIEGIIRGEPLPNCVSSSAVLCVAVPIVVRRVRRREASASAFDLLARAAQVAVGTIPRSCEPIQHHVLYSALSGPELSPDEFAVCIQFCNAQGEKPAGWVRLVQAEPKREQCLRQIRPLLCRLTNRCLSMISGSTSDVTSNLRALATLITFLGSDCDLVASSVTSSLIRSPCASTPQSVEVLTAVVNSSSQQYLDTNTPSLAVAMAGQSIYAPVIERLQERTRTLVSWPAIRFLMRTATSNLDWDIVLGSATALLSSLSGERRRQALEGLQSAFSNVAPADRPHIFSSPTLNDLCSVLIACCDSESHALPASMLLGFIGVRPEAAARSVPINDKVSVRWREFVFEALSVFCLDSLEADYDRAAFTVQELLRISAAEEQQCDIGKAELSGRTLNEYTWWSSLGLRRQQLFEPFQTTTYFRPDLSTDRNEGKIFIQGMTCSAWQLAWCKRLITGSTGVLKSLFDVFRPVASTHSGALTFLIKSCLVHAISTSSESHGGVVDELHWVSEATSDDNVHQTVVDILGCLRGAEDKLVRRAKGSTPEERSMLQTIRSFWGLIDRDVLVASSLRCGAHMRALYYTEGARSLPSGPALGALAPSLRALGEHTAASSLTAGSASLSGPYHTDYEREDGLALGEQMMIRGLDGGVCRYVRALTGLGQFSAAVSAAKEHPHESGVTEEVQEAAWKLAAWDVVAPVTHAGVSVPLKGLYTQAAAVPELVAGEFAKLAKEVSVTVREVGQLTTHQLSVAAGLQDILFCNTSRNEPTTVESYLLSRGDQDVRSPDLCALRKQLSQLVGLELGKVDLKESAELANAGRLKAAVAVLKRYELDTGSNVDEEVADVLWSVGRKLEAVHLLSDASRRTSLPSEVRGRLMARSAERGGALQVRSVDEASSLFDEALALSPKCQDTLNAHGMFHYAQYTGIRDSLLEVPPSKKGDKTPGASECAQHAVLGLKSLGASLVFGSKHLILAMPRLLTLWLDSTALIEKRGHTASLVQDINAAASQVIAKCAASLFAVSLPQLLSRLGHANTDVLELISQVVLKLLSLYPQQTLWQVLPLCYSATNPSRADLVSRKILVPFSAGDKTLTSHMKVLFDSFTSICVAGNAIAERNLPELSFMKPLLKLLPVARYIMPRVSSLYPSLNTSSQGSTLTYQHTRVTIASFGNRVDLMSSLMKPKRIRVVDSTGSSNFYLLKSKDEPRKDIRMMEIAMIVNHLFKKGGASRGSEGCSLKRYAVLALSDDCAAIEWVANTVTLRKLAEECYALDGTGVSLNAIKGLLDKVKEGRLSKMNMFDQHIFPAAPPVLHHWLVRSFPTPHLWYKARVRFTQSCAQWSMCGHIVGLGDRHGENLLLCTDTGEVMHVDFAVMFDKGELLEVPERVRFRLTPNLVDAMGVAGANGEFKATSEASLSTLCSSKDVVLGVLETFTHDPLIEWSKRGGTDVRHLMKRCSRRLDGFLDLYDLPRDHTSLSYSGQVARLIDHSSSKAVLADMYIWWMAWM